MHNGVLFQQKMLSPFICLCTNDILANMLSFFFVCLFVCFLFCFVLFCFVLFWLCMHNVILFQPKMLAPLYMSMQNEFYFSQNCCHFLFVYAQKSFISAKNAVISHLSMHKGVLFQLKILAPLICLCTKEFYFS